MIRPTVLNYIPHDPFRKCRLCSTSGAGVGCQGLWCSLHSLFLGEALWLLVLGLEVWAVPGALSMGTLDAQACGDSQSLAQHAQNSALETTGAAAGWCDCSFLCCVNMKLSYLWGCFLHICSYRNRFQKHFLMPLYVMWDKFAFWSETNLISNPDSVTSLMTELLKGLRSLSVKW